jgi:hypothetical protein
MERLIRIDMYLAMVRMWPTKAQEQSELIKYVDSLATHLNIVLKDSFKRFKADKIIKELCFKWDKLTGTSVYAVKIKDIIIKLCAAIEDDKGAQRVTDCFQSSWLDFLESKRKKSPECRLCHVRIEHMPYVGTPLERLREHFIRTHWQSTEAGN